MRKTFLNIKLLFLWVLGIALTITSCEHPEADSLSVKSKDYSIEFNKNDDSAGGTVPSSISGVYGESTLGFPDGSSMTPPPSKPFFVGWTSNRDGTGFQVTGGSTFKIDSEHFSSISGGVLVFYAQWSTLPPSGYRVLFKNLGGSSEDFTPSYLSFTDLTLGFTTAPFPGQGSELTSPDSSLPYLQGWNTKADGSGRSVILGDTYTLDSNDAEDKDIVFYAIWGSNKVEGVKPDNLGSNLFSSPIAGSSFFRGKGKYNVFFNGNGSTGDPPFSYEDHLYLANGSSVSIPDQGSMTSGPSGEQYFLGWTLDREGLTKPLYTKDGEHNQYIVDYNDAGGYNIYFYAQWSSDAPNPPTYSIVFDKNGGGGNAPTPLGPYEAGATSDAFPDKGSMTGPADKNNLVSWNTQADGSGTSVAIGATYTVASSDADDSKITFYAQWRDNNVTIVFDIDGGKYGNNKKDPPSEMVVKIGTSYDLHRPGIYIKQKDRKLYRGVGWEVISASGSVQETIDGYSYSVKSNHIRASDNKIHMKIYWGYGSELTSEIKIDPTKWAVRFVKESPFKDHPMGDVLIPKYKKLLGKTRQYTYKEIKEFNPKDKGFLVEEVLNIPNNELPQDCEEFFHFWESLERIPTGLDASNVRNMTEMFAFAKKFRQDISDWNVDQVGDNYREFAHSTSFQKSDVPARFRNGKANFKW